MKKCQVVIKRAVASSSDSARNSSSSSSSFAVRTVRYGKCQKNQAASLGGYAVDGCREFMPCGEEGTNEAMTCAACGCHRRFHLRVLVENEVACDCNNVVVRR